MPATITVVNGQTIIQAGENSALARADRILAENAAAAALAAAGVGEQPDTATGLGATAIGDRFWVDQGDGTGKVYLHEAGPVATFTGQRFALDITDTGAAAVIGTEDGVSAQEAANRDKFSVLRSAASPVAYDDFPVDGALSGRTSPSGHAWTVLGTGAAPTITDGWVSEPSQKTFYGMWNLGANVDTFSARFKFDPTGLNPTTLNQPEVRPTFAIYDGSSIPTNIKWHFNPGWRSWSMFPFVGGVSQNSGTDDDGTPTQGYWQLDPGVEYTATIKCLSDTSARFRVLSDTGQVILDETFVFAAVAGIATDHTFIETIPSGASTDDYSHVAKIALPAVGERREPGIDRLALLRGKDFNAWKYGGSFVASADGFYPIAEGISKSGAAPLYMGAGRIKLSLRSTSGAYENIIIEPEMRPVTSPVLACNFDRIQSLSTPLGQVRLSHDGVSASRIEIELPSAATHAVTVNWWIEGYLSPVAVPDAATGAYATSSLFTVPPASLIPLTATISAAGWSTVAIGGALIGYSMGAKLLVYATDNAGGGGSRTTIAEIVVGGRAGGGGADLHLSECWPAMHEGGGACTQARVSRDSSNDNQNDIQLDLYFPDATSHPVALTIVADPTADFVAWVNPPTSGATALTTEKTEIILGGARQYASGRYYPFDGPSVYANGVAPGANVLAIMPGRIRERVKISSLAAKVTTLSASGNFKIYVWAADPATGHPTGAPIISSAAISTGTATTVEDNTVSAWLDPGLYWWGVICDTSGASAAFLSASTTALGISQQAGHITLTSVLGAAFGWTVAATYGSPPTLTGNLATDGFAAAGSQKPAVIAFKVA